MKCIICGNENLEVRDTIISDFVMARIDPYFEVHRVNKKTKLCFCHNCTFAFYEYRLAPHEETLLYKNYRDRVYQKTREKYECWYTEKVNDAINSGNVKKQQKIIRKVLESCSFDSFREALDYGGNRGATFYDELGTESKWVYEISGVDPLPGIKSIKSFDELNNYHYDFIMCNMVLEHVTSPYDIMKKLHSIGSSDTVYYLNP